MKPTERDLWGDVTQEVISDEEDTQERLKVKSLASSGNKEVNNLIEALDQKKKWLWPRRFGTITQNKGSQQVSS